MRSTNAAEDTLCPLGMAKKVSVSLVCPYPQGTGEHSTFAATQVYREEPGVEYPPVPCEPLRVGWTSWVSPAPSVDGG
jgi:hypothetical protein